jgi:DNA-binding HxlR family transcriptional regulator
VGNLTPVQRASFEDMNCSIARSLEVIGEWWTLLILRDAFLGITRFEDFRKRLGIARNILTRRLDALVTAGVLERRTYDAARGRHDYLLTAKGRALWPVLAALRQWGDEWLTGTGNEPVLLRHDACGHTTRVMLTCEHCGRRLRGREIRLVPGPGLTDPEFLPAAGPPSDG